MKGFKSINIVFDVGKYHRWSNILSTLQVGIKEKISELPSLIQKSFHPYYPHQKVFRSYLHTHNIVPFHLEAQHLWVYKSEYLLAYYNVRLFWAQFYQKFYAIRMFWLRTFNMLIMDFKTGVVYNRQRVHKSYFCAHPAWWLTVQPALPWQEVKSSRYKHIETGSLPKGEAEAAPRFWTYNMKRCSPKFWDIWVI